MSPDRLLIAGDEAAFRREAARLVAESSAAAVAERKRFILALAGGSTPKRVYEQLADPFFRMRIAWERAHFFWGDERCVPPDDGESNYLMAKRALLDPLSIPPARVFRMKGEMEPPEAAARDYQNAMKAFFRQDLSIPRFDFMFLGIGNDGHTASLFPRTAALDESERWVVSNRVEALQATRLTLTYPVLNAARRIVFLVSGEGKSEIVREIFREDASPNRFPAQRVRPDAGELIWLLDRPAASKIPRSASEVATVVSA